MNSNPIRPISFLILWNRVGKHLKTYKREFILCEHNCNLQILHGWINMLLTPLPTQNYPSSPTSKQINNHPSRKQHYSPTPKLRRKVRSFLYFCIHLYLILYSISLWCTSDCFNFGLTICFSIIALKFQNPNSIFCLRVLYNYTIFNFDGPWSLDEVH